MSAIRPTLSEIICTEQVRLLYASLPVSLVITIISASILAIMQADILEQVPVIGWLLAILLVTTARAVLAFSYRRAAPDGAQSKIWLQRFRLGALAAGLTWGAAGWWLFTPNDIAHQAFLAIVLVGIAAGATSLSVDRPAAFSFILALLLPLIVHLLSGSHPLQLAMGFMGLLLLTVLSVNAHRLHRNIIDNLSLRLAAEPREQALRESEARWHYALNGAGDGVWDWNPRSNNVFFSPRWKAMLGYADADIGTTAMEWDSRVHPEDKAQCYADIERHLSGETATYVNEHRMRCKDGSYKWILDRGQVVERDAAGAPLRMIGTHTDISERKAVETALADSRLRLQTIIEAEPECVKQLAADGTLLQMNRAGLDMIEADSADQVIGHKVTGIITPASRKDFMALTQRVFAGGRGTLAFEIVGLKGSRRWLETHAVPLRDTQGKITALLSVTRDITERKAATEHIQHLAHHDALTDLPNRSLLHERLTQAILLAQRKNEALAVMFLDLDRFKHVNDSLGHQVGDRLLVEVARRLQTCVRASDTLARLGGDEFVLVLADVTGTHDATHAVQKMFAVLQQPFLLEGRELTITPSIGISLFPEDGRNADELIRNADAAMYQAKEAGRSTFHFYTADMNARALDLLALEAALRRALERNELVLFYQPKIELASGRMIGVEALIRWQHPEWGLVSPARFIPLAEETGLILPIGEWALREACQQAAAWRAQGQTLTVAVNLAARQFRQPALAARVAAILAETGLDAAALELEITESAMMHDPQQVTATLSELKRIGVRIAIDDFGTGYSSLGYLKLFPVDVLKIDQTFIRDAPTHSRDAAIVRVIIEMARALELQVVAEGVETAAHLDFVQAMGCDLAQGYLFAKPMPASELLQQR
ncbi:MAG: EAL domain-containing protein [Gammaproteobacteria bacterium]|nr:EAL domain-containing protein [Gammaproteobacteria bacterium]